MSGSYYSHAEPVTPDDCLGNLLAHLALDQPLSASTREWATRGILQTIRRREPMEAALRLAGPGLEDLGARLARIQRDQYITQALAAVALDDGITDWQRCTRLAPLVARFTADIWPKTKRLHAPPDTWPEYKKALWHAAATDCTLPESPRALLDVLKRNGGFSPHKTGAKLLATFL